MKYRKPLVTEGDVAVQLKEAREMALKTRSRLPASAKLGSETNGHGGSSKLFLLEEGMLQSKWFVMGTANSEKNARNQARRYYTASVGLSASKTAPRLPEGHAGKGYWEFASDTEPNDDGVFEVWAKYDG